MDKLSIGPKPILFPMPTVVVGTEVEGRVNYMTFAYCGIMGYEPPLIAISPGKGSYTYGAIPKAGVFSVNIPSMAEVAATDYCGLTSAKKTDKSHAFRTFYGKTPALPLASECPVNLECRLVHTYDHGGSDVVYIAEITEVHVNPDCMVDGKIDMGKVDPILFCTTDRFYWKVGGRAVKAFDVGRGFLREQPL
jgi:flavin reductase (DIM6/NTAB) family NADH-FMN oxidoreductase RutF